MKKWKKEILLMITEQKYYKAALYNYKLFIEQLDKGTNK